VSGKPTIYEALSRVMADVQAVRKDNRNQQQGYSFRGIDAVVNAVGPALREHGVIVVPHVEDVQYNVVEVGQRRTPMRECTVRVRYVFHGPAGDTIDCVSIGEAMDSGDKATPKAMSVAMRVALLQALCIPTDEPDPDSTAYERAPVRQEPSPRSVALSREIDNAADSDALRAKWREVHAAALIGEITVDEAAQLKERITRRFDSLKQPEQPSGESAADWPETATPGGGA